MQQMWAVNARRLGPRQGNPSAESAHSIRQQASSHTSTST